MEKNPDNEREKLLLHSLSDVVQEEKTKVSTLQTNVSNLQTTVSSLGTPPTKTSDLTNDSGFITNANLPTKTSDLQNDSGFLTAHQDVSGKENTANKTTTIDENSTNTQYPTALAVFNLMEENMINTTDLENGIDDLNTTNTNLKNTLNDKLQALTVAVRGIGADFSQVDAITSDVKSGKKFYDTDGLLQTGTIPTYDGSTSITENGTIATANKFVASDLTIAVPQPTLFSPTISLSGNTITITNPATNSSFVENYKIFSNDTLVCTTSNSTVNLANYLQDIGTYTITAKCCGTGFVDSNASASVSYVVTENPTITSIAEISALSTTSDDSDFNTSTHEKLPFMTQETNGPSAVIYFRQAPNETLTPTIVLQLFLQNIPSGTTSLPCNIKLNDTVISSTALTVVSDQDYQATITLSNLTSLSFNKLEIDFNDSTLSTMQLDYVDITISNTHNCIILNRDDSFALSSNFKTDGSKLSVYSTNNSDGFKYGVLASATLNDILNPTTVPSTTYDRSNNTPRIAYARISGFDRDNVLTAYSSYSYECILYFISNNVSQLFHKDTWDSSTHYFDTGVIQNSPSIHNGEVKRQLIEVNPSAFFCLYVKTNYSVILAYNEQPNVAYNFKLNSTDVPNEFVGVCGIQDCYMSQRTTYVENVGFFLIHKSGTIIFFPRVNNTYCLKIGKGKQVNAYLSEDGLNINVYFNVDNKIKKRTLTRSEILADSVWTLSNVTEFQNTKEICEWGDEKIYKDTSNVWHELT